MSSLDTKTAHESLFEGLVPVDPETILNINSKDEFDAVCAFLEKRRAGQAGANNVGPATSATIETVMVPPLPSTPPPPLPTSKLAPKPAPKPAPEPAPEPASESAPTPVVKSPVNMLWGKTAWSCQQCTLNNGSDKNRCSLCETLGHVPVTTIRKIPRQAPPAKVFFYATVGDFRKACQKTGGVCNFGDRCTRSSCTWFHPRIGPNSVPMQYAQWKTACEQKSQLWKTACDQKSQLLRNYGYCMSALNPNHKRDACSMPHIDNPLKFSKDSPDKLEKWLIANSPSKASRDVPLSSYIKK